ncbi:MAG: hypothetical protein AAGK47_10025 [Bacteroidota bacterium]
MKQLINNKQKQNQLGGYFAKSISDRSSFAYFSSITLVPLLRVLVVRRSMGGLLICIIAAASLHAQSTISGSWKGVITQDDGGYRTRYDFELYLNVKDNQITGRSYVTVDDIFCEMKITGSLQEGQKVYFKEIELVDSRQTEGMEWCFKQAVLRLGVDHGKVQLSGSWEGTTSFSNCIPGKVFLQKIVPRA